jgi:hypothetical protein
MLDAARPEALVAVRLARESFHSLEFPVPEKS